MIDIIKTPVYVEKLNNEQMTKMFDKNDKQIAEFNDIDQAMLANIMINKYETLKEENILNNRDIVTTTRAILELQQQNKELVEMLQKCINTNMSFDLLIEIPKLLNRIKEER